ncbi:MULTISPECIES: hypothetical protein [unclassified Leptolyngbya]|uniref:arginine synthesis PII-interacting regulator PirA n=1 Tax=unclassified Leptolyngbya TaxID=2650499 RepID=UPI00168292DD|nr:MULTISPECIES: hypothetical protein [unclassified Leptolyngbya]MBD1909630.1 hypothetical protein [Leptolyngbya sp. FACHB-8]MBD2154168.1 hypothetical protein [Leptolyngbya sp. FACHB-16]
MLRNPKQSRNEIAQAHRENLRQNLQRRMEAAQARGDEDLLRQLQAEAQYIG